MNIKLPPFSAGGAQFGESREQMGTKRKPDFVRGRQPQYVIDPDCKSDTMIQIL
jgi:hypothetical protein